MKYLLITGLFVMLVGIGLLRLVEYQDTHRQSDERDSVYIQALREFDPNYTFNESEYIELAKGSCSLLQAGRSPIYIFSSVKDDFTAYAIYTGVSVYCSNYLAVITDTN